jgi:RNA polymerase sigma-70 factor (ECF subfamily)
MVANGCTDRHRRRRCTSALDELPEEPSQRGDDAFDLLRVAHRQRWIEGLFNHLPSEQAEVVRLRIYGELPFEAVAEAVGCSLAAAKARFRYGIRRLRQEIGKEVSYDL